MNLTGDRSGGITVNNVPLVRRDVMATNGVLHSIDQVFVPDEGQLNVTLSDESYLHDVSVCDTCHRKVTLVVTMKYIQQILHCLTYSLIKIARNYYLIH